MPRKRLRNCGEDLFNYYVPREESDSIEDSLSLNNVVDFFNESFEREENSLSLDISEESDKSEAIEPLNLRNKLAQWSIKNNVTNTAVNELLSILKVSIPDLSRDCRSLKETPREVLQQNIAGGLYKHYGIGSALR